MIIKTNAMQFRFDTLENWEKANPVLLLGEPAVAEVNGLPKMKIGNGVDRWKDLPFVSNNDKGNVTWEDITGRPNLAKYENVIETIKVDNVALGVANKSVNIDLSGKQDVMREITNEEIDAMFREE